MKSLLICVEGINGSGEGTNARELFRKLKERGYDVSFIAFPDYTTPIGKEISKFLLGERDFSTEVRQALYAANRWERKADIEKWLKEDRIVVADRYTPSGLAYGLANKLNLDWSIRLEEGLPPPDLVILLDVSVETHFRRTQKSDIYETNKNFLESVRQAYLTLAKEYKWFIVNGERQLNDVTREVWDLVSAFIRSKNL